MGGRGGRREKGEGRGQEGKNDLTHPLSQIPGYAIVTHNSLQTLADDGTASEATTINEAILWLACSLLVYRIHAHKWAT